VSHDEHSLDRNTIRAGCFAQPLAGGTQISLGAGKGRVLGNGILFSVLGFKIVILAHDGIDWYLVRAAWLAEAAGMAAVKIPTSLPVGCQLIFFYLT